ncbi:MAG: hypothetical protein FWF12_07470 [Betaproteobacteria bacterium]|nr:hypothetical protein [Betaproteobacteria bacterium]
MNTPWIGSMHEHSFDTATLSALARQHSSVPLRRAGSLIELVIVGLASVLDKQPDMPTAVLWGSQIGVAAVGYRLISCIEIAREAVFPFDFLASQPIVAAIALKKSFPCIENVLYQPWPGDAAVYWQRLRTLAAAWLRAGRCARVVCGQAEPDESGESEHIGRWQILQR